MGPQQRTLDVVGKKFGRLTVLNADFTSKRHVVFRCRCDCGDIKPFVYKSQLDKGTLRCLRCEHKHHIGKTFSRLVILDEMKFINNRENYFCRCVCGTEKWINKSGILGGTIRSCGCLRVERVLAASKGRDLTGERLGMLTILEELPSPPKSRKNNSQNRHKTWKCQCECGNIKNISRHVLVGLTKPMSCGCSKSSNGEMAIENYLKLRNVKFERSYTKENIRLNASRPLRIDFYLPDHDLFIEYNGRQHYKEVPVGTWGMKTQEETETLFVRQLKRDSLVRNTLRDRLLEIAYWDFDNIDKIIRERLGI